ARLGVRVLDLTLRRSGRLAAGILERRGEAGAQRDVVGARAALYRLVVVVADRVPLGERLQVRGVALRHVVEAHRHGALEDRGGRVGAIVVAGRVGHPGGELVVVRDRLLPHLVEAVQRVADERAGELAAALVLGVRVRVGDVLGDLERAVRQGRGDAGVRAAAGQTVAAGSDIGRVRLGQ